MIGFFDSSRQPLILKEGILKEVLWEKLKDIVVAKGKGALFTGLFLEPLAPLLPRGEESVEGEGGRKETRGDWDKIQHYSAKPRR